MNRCQTCGACCAKFRVTFPREELDDVAGGVVPAEYAVILDDAWCAMKGSLGFSPRCAALMGKIGEGVSCAIYENRPSACRDLHASWEKDFRCPLCDRARASYGMQPFEIF